MLRTDILSGNESSSMVLNTTKIETAIGTKENNSEEQQLKDLAFGYLTSHQLYILRYASIIEDKQ